MSVDACLFQAKGVISKVKSYKCDVFDNLSKRSMGVINGKIIPDIQSYKSLENIDKQCEFRWRSGIKHDAAKVMEFEYIDGALINGNNEKSKLPFDYLYPMYKSSNIAKPILTPPKKYMLVTQHKIGEETKIIEKLSPGTWYYLIKHSEKLDSRRSSIYVNSPRFSIFGVGEYTFLPWKVVISGLYKNIIFSKIGHFNDKPIVIDDTCYMLGFEKENQADLVLKLLNSNICKKFINSIVFLDSKRPITVSLLNRINLREVAKELEMAESFDKIFPKT